MLFSRTIVNIFSKTLLVRNDNAQGLFYFSHGDFPGLQAHGFRFRAKAGHALQGWFYHYPDPIPGRLVVFDHGMGNGHRAYMVEIERLAKAGFLVFSYDHTGCMASEGPHIGGFAQSLSDLDACITALKALPELSGRSVAVMGHSWGGFSTMNIAALHPQITHLVALSGFVSVERILDQFLPGPLKLYRRELMALERKANPGYADSDAIESLRATRARVLLIGSDNDPTVRYDRHHRVLQQALAGQPNIQCISVHGRGHNPNYTDDAVAYMADFWKKLNNAKAPEAKKALLADCDWRRMTAQDDALWARILAHLKEETP